MAGTRQLCVVVGGFFGLPARVLNDADDGVPEMVSDSGNERFVACDYPTDVGCAFIAGAISGTPSPRSSTW